MFHLDIVRHITENRFKKKKKKRTLPKAIAVVWLFLFSLKFTVGYYKVFTLQPPQKAEQYYTCTLLSSSKTTPQTQLSSPEVNQDNLKSFLCVLSCENTLWSNPLVLIFKCFVDILGVFVFLVVFITYSLGYMIKGISGKQSRQEYF